MYFLKYFLSIHYLQSNKVVQCHDQLKLTNLKNNKMKTINCYLKSLKFAMYFIPVIPLNHPSPCLLAVCRETIKANLLLQINS